MSKFLQSLVSSGRVPFYVDFRTGSAQSLSGMVAGVAPTVVGTPKFTQMRGGRAADFRTGYLVYPHQADQALTSFTLMMRMSLNPRSTAFESTVSKRDGTGTAYDVFLNTAGVVEYYTGTGNYGTGIPLPVLSDATVAWRHVNGQAPQLFLDGAQISSFASAGNIGAAAAPIYVGARYTSTIPLLRPMWAAVIVNEALSPADIARLHRELVDAPGIVKRARKNFISYATVAPARHCLLDARVHTDGSCPVSLAAVPAQGVLANGWKVESGTWRVVEDAPVSGKPGKRWIQQAAGPSAISVQDTSAYGTWVFEVSMPAVPNTTPILCICSDAPTMTGNSYSVTFYASGVIAMHRKAGGVTAANLQFSGNGFLQAGSTYTMMVTRRFDGQWKLWVRGGQHTSWTLVGTTPTDNTYQSSKFSLIYSSTTTCLTRYGGIRHFLGEMLPEEIQDMGIL